MTTEMEDAHMEESENSRDLEVAPALIAVHPSQKSVTVAVGSDLRVYDLHKDDSVSLVDDSDKPFHKDSIRAIRYGSSGELFVSAGDDKLVKIWSTVSWHCICTVSADKRVSAIAISNDNLHVCFADKFGVVWVLRLEEEGGKFCLVNKKAASLLSHYCSIITSLEFSPDGRFIVSADRDFKIRVTVFPKRPLDGAHEIQSFCLGHSEFISCLDFICSPDNPVGFLVSGSGDSTVRLWDITLGSLLSTCEVGPKAGLLESTGKEEEKKTNGVGEDNFCAVTDLCAVQNGTLIAVAIQSYKGILLLSCDFSAKSLSLVKVVPVVGESFIPTSLATSSSQGLLWMVTGISKLNGVNFSSMGRVRAMSGFKENSELEPMMLEDEAIPGGKKLLEKLQGSVLIEESVYLAAAEALKTAMSNLLIKKLYSVEKRETRKRTRNDKKFKQ